MDNLSSFTTGETVSVIKAICMQRSTKQDVNILYQHVMQRYNGKSVAIETDDGTEMKWNLIEWIFLAVFCVFSQPGPF